MEAKLSIAAGSTNWAVHFAIIPNSFDPSSMPTSDIAVCTSLPYISKIETKRDSVGAIFFEWLRYYSSLGFRVIAFDATGQHQQFISDSSYSKAQQLDRDTAEAMQQRVTYHNFSILSKLRPSMLTVLFDNNFQDIESIAQLDDDHTLSLTHCRFDALAQWGVSKVLLVDFDEFLFCHNEGESSSNQRRAIDRHLRPLAAQSI